MNQVTPQAIVDLNIPGLRVETIEEPVNTPRSIKLTYNGKTVILTVCRVKGLEVVGPYIGLFSDGAEVPDAHWPKELEREGDSYTYIRNDIEPQTIEQAKQEPKPEETQDNKFDFSQIKIENRFCDCAVCTLRKRVEAKLGEDLADKPAAFFLNL